MEERSESCSVSEPRGRAGVERRGGSRRLNHRGHVTKFISDTKSTDAVRVNGRLCVWNEPANQDLCLQDKCSGTFRLSETNDVLVIDPHKHQMLE